MTEQTQEIIKRWCYRARGRVEAGEDADKIRNDFSKDLETFIYPLLWKLKMRGEITGQEAIRLMNFCYRQRELIR